MAAFSSSSGFGSGSAEANEFQLASPGESALTLLPPETVNMRLVEAVEVHHGSSLSLISKATAVLNDYFTEMDPEKDYKKWSKIGTQIYFLCIFHESSGTPCSVVRLLLDGDFSSVAVGLDSMKCKRRIIIDYLFTLQEVQGRGHGSRLFALVQRLADTYKANLYVLALEDSCVYWMSKGFVLDEGDINKRLNVFPDTHLLKLPSNREEDPDTITPIDLSEDEEEDAMDQSEDTTTAPASDDEGLQRALLASLASSEPRLLGETSASVSVSEEVVASESEGQERDDLAAAMALSMAEADDGDEELRRALALSVQEK